ncbi:hypothetical protein M409DRAFT_70983 [Zasmidium cellare ATCC 36951]|uniref:Flavin reductase like domain-containing protein n=1 Tax=Zasmidium cellare ATCC 36951 TaxID=1080233 RepID=A0A6A6C077_ZASCE|nr:uncharacterized protein M409DRAFT_70983 [Zasmidium cellare ATCC 36951]KAF2159550.1 hypothetical protein M409DRAFT_70983 [Zasmidium cellare ATCC 36951]
MTNSTTLNPGAHFAANSARRPFKETESERPDWDTTRSGFSWHKTLNPAWKLGDGASKTAAPPSQIPIDPFEEGRSPLFNYRLITSAVIPRPTAVMSTLSADGSSNLAPYSFFQAMSHDPPTFVVSQAVSGDQSKDTLRNLRETGECVINLLNEDIIEAGNACSVQAPHGVSEWALSGLTPAKGEVVKASRIAEAAFAVECKLKDVYEIQSRANPGSVSSAIAILEGVRFWVREEAVDEDRKTVDMAKSKAVGRLYGIGYTRILEGFQIPWPTWEEEVDRAEKEGLVKPKVDGQ